MNSEGTDVYLVQSTKITGNLSLRLPLCVILILCVRKKNQNNQSSQRKRRSSDQWKKKENKTENSFSW